MQLATCHTFVALTDGKASVNECPPINVRHQRRRNRSVGSIVIIPSERGRKNQSCCVAIRDTMKKIYAILFIAFESSLGVIDENVTILVVSSAYQECVLIIRYAISIG